MLRDQLLFPSSAPHTPSEMGLHLGLLKPRVPEFARQSHAFGAIRCPHTSVSDLSQLGSSNRGISPEISVPGDSVCRSADIGVSPCSRMPQPPAC